MLEKKWNVSKNLADPNAKIAKPSLKEMLAVALHQKKSGKARKRKIIGV